MNELRSDHERKYIARRIAATIRSFAEMSPVTIVTGARQVGKSTLLQHEFPDYTYLTLDDFSVLERARVDPAALWKGAERLVIDEAQKAPRLFEALKLEVDQSNRRKSSSFPVQRISF
jgi:predicted AAA+ superfamily ATPase